MKLFINLVIGVLMLGMNLSVLANDGEKNYQQVCASCHGKNAEGNDALGSPALAAQSTDYLIRQYNNFANGLRGTHADDSYGKQMVAMSSVLADDIAVKNVAEYLSSLPVAKQSVVEGDAKNGYRYYQSCGSCHGAKAQGNPALSAPRLAGLSAEYLKRQHKNFNDSLRGTHADDRLGRQMKMMAGTMKDEKILNDVIAYITSIED